MNCLKVITLSIASFALSSGINAQVSNGNFSTISKAPKNFDQLNRASGWNNANTGTADLYHSNAKSCSKMGTENKVGQQAPFSGDGYAGIITYYNDLSTDWASSIRSGEEQTTSGYGKYSEYITTKLDAPLKAGQSYTFMFYASLADKSGYAQRGLGALFTNDPVSTGSNSFIQQTPQIESSSVIDSKDKWVKVSGRFTAKGGEQYVTIGVFQNDHSPVSVDGGEGLSSKRAYYYIDGIGFQKGKDSDGDGIIDSEDKCPEIAGQAEYDGCPLSDEEVNAIKSAAEHIYFNSGSSTIKESSHEDLDKLVSILKKHPEIKVAIEGHTDNTGNANSNLQLSKDRAKAVKDYLIEHGEPADHITSEGYGQTRPRATNDTKEGRAKNRRVEVKISMFK